MESYRYSDDRFYSVFHPVSEIANDFLCVIIVLKNNEEEQVYVNKYGKLVFGDLLCYTCYYLGPFDLSYTPEHGKYSLRHGIGSRASGNPLHSQVSRWKSASSSRKGDLQHRYDAIAFCHIKYSANWISWTQTFNRHQLQPPPHQPDYLDFHSQNDNTLYVPGSILCPQLLCSPESPYRVLVGRAWPWPYGWKWDISLHKESSWEEVVNLSFDKFVI